MSKEQELLAQYIHWKEQVLNGNIDEADEALAQMRQIKNELFGLWSEVA